MLNEYVSLMIRSFRLTHFFSQEMSNVLFAQNSSKIDFSVFLDKDTEWLIRKTITSIS